MLLCFIFSLRVCVGACVCADTGASVRTRWSSWSLQFVLPGHDAVVHLLVQWCEAPSAGVQEVQSVRHGAGVEAVPPQLRLLELERPCTTREEGGSDGK